MATDPSKSSDPISDEVAVPQSDSMGVAEALTWIAYRKALPLGSWGEQVYSVSRKWPWNPIGFFDRKLIDNSGHEFWLGPNVFLEMLESPEAERDWEFSWGTGRLSSFCQSNIDDLLRGEDISTLCDALRQDISIAVIANSKLGQARTKLREALKSGQISSVGQSVGKTWWVNRSAIPASTWITGITLLPDDTVHEERGIQLYSHVLFETSEIVALWPKDRAADHAPLENGPEDTSFKVSPQTSPSRPAGGRPPKHDWDAFWIEIVLFAAKEDIQPGDRERLRQHMNEWVAKNSKDPPEESTIAKRLKRLFDMVAAR